MVCASVVSSAPSTDVNFPSLAWGCFGFFEGDSQPSVQEEERVAEQWREEQHLADMRSKWGEAATDEQLRSVATNDAVIADREVGINGIATSVRELHEIFEVRRALSKEEFGARLLLWLLLWLMLWHRLWLLLCPRLWPQLWLWLRLWPCFRLWLWL